VVSDLPPVEENIDRTEHASQTFLDRFSLCPRSAYLYRKHEGGPRSHAMDRGVLIHAVFEKQLRLMVEQGEHYVPPELAKDLAAELLAERTDLVVPPGEADAVRLMAFHLAEGIAIDPSTVVAIEDTFELPLGDFILRGRIDAAFLPEKDRLVVWDLKSSLAVPNQEDFEHSFQHPFYAVLLAFGKPAGSPFGIGQGVQWFEMVNLYPRYLSDHGIPERRHIISRNELLDHRLYLEATHAFESGEWPAVPGSHCSTCAAPTLCPLPSVLRDHQGEITTFEQACEAAEWWKFTTDQAARVKKDLKGFAEHEGRSIPIGADLELAFSYSESPTLPDLRELLEEDGPVDLKGRVKVRKSTTFAARKVKAEEEVAA
jgi:hypothetical protein